MSLSLMGTSVAILGMDEGEEDEEAMRKKRIARCEKSKRLKVKSLKLKQGKELLSKSEKATVQGIKVKKTNRGKNV